MISRSILLTKTKGTDSKKNTACSHVHSWRRKQLVSIQLGTNSTRAAWLRPRKLGAVSNAHQRALVIYYALRGLQLHPIDAAWPIINARLTNNGSFAWHESKQAPGKSTSSVGGTEGEAVIDRNRKRTSKNKPPAKVIAGRSSTADSARHGHKMGGWVGFPPMGAVRGAETAKHK